MTIYDNGGPRCLEDRSQLGTVQLGPPRYSWVHRRNMDPLQKVDGAVRVCSVLNTTDFVYLNGSAGQESTKSVGVGLRYAGDQKVVILKGV